MAKINAKPLIAGVSKPVSQFALGTASFRLESRAQHFDLLDAYTEAGGAVIDSARAYGDSEAVIGLWLEARNTRAQTIIITKCGHGADGALPRENFSEGVASELTTSLHTLRTDFVDLYLLHRDNQEMPVATILEPLNRELANGRVQAIGASNWEYRRVTEANEYADKHGLKGFAVVSNTISLARPAAAFYRGLVSTDPVGERWHTETGIPLLPWSSQARGFFTGQYTQQMRENLTSATSFVKRMVTVYCTDDNFERLDRAKALGEKKGGYTAVEVALAWLLHKPFPLVPIVGPRTKEELASCIKAISLSLTESEMKWLNLEARDLS